MEELISCDICTNILNDPVVLPCNDYACSGCLVSTLELRENSMQKSRINIFDDQDMKRKCTCPICRQTIILPTDGVSTLPKYKIMEPVIDALSNESIRINCDFCEDYEPQKATMKCSECKFNYCGVCFDLAHIQKGPFANHKIIEPSLNSKSYHVCMLHPSEKKNLYCHDCNLCICFLCKEIGKHSQHKTQLATTLFEREKVNLKGIGEELRTRDQTLTEAIGKCDDYSLYLKQAGLESESHVIRECDQLIRIIEAKKEMFLTEISSEFDKLIETTASDLQCLKEDQHFVRALQEVIGTASNEKDAISNIESVEPLKKRIITFSNKCDMHLVETNNNLNKLAYSGMVLDINPLKEELNNISWLKPPKAPVFEMKACQTSNNKLSLCWIPPKGRVDSYHLEWKRKNNDFELVYQGPDYQDIIMEADYNETIFVRVCAKNSSGKGEYSKTMKISTAASLDFKIDTVKTDEDIKLSRDHTSARCEIKDDKQTAYGDVIISHGQHYWKLKISKFVADDKLMDGFILCGITAVSTTKNNISNYVPPQYCIMLCSQPNVKDLCGRYIRVNCSAEEIIEQVITFDLNIEDQYLDIYVNGVLIMDKPLAKHTFTNLAPSLFHPCVIFKKIKSQIKFITGLQRPERPPFKMKFQTENCKANNTKVTFSWLDIIPSADAYKLEVFEDLEASHNGRILYQGNRTTYTYDIGEYRKQIYARVYAVNIHGVGEFSDIICVETDKGLNFSFKEHKNPYLQLWSLNRSVKYSNTSPIMLFGDRVLSKGVHFWKLVIEQFHGKTTKLSVGLSRPEINIEAFGVRDSYAVTITTKEPTDLPRFTISVVKRKKKILQTEFAFLVDFERRRFYCYENGSLVTKSTDDLINIPRFLWSFNNIQCDLYPAVRCEGNMKFAVFCNQSLTSKPSAPSFGECYCDNITCSFNWFISDAPGSYTNYCVLKVMTVRIGKHSKHQKLDKFQEVYRGPSKTHVLKQLPYHSKVIAVLTAVNSVGESEDSERIVLFTAKGFFFEFDQTKKSDSIILSNESQTAQLSGPIHSYVLGNRVLTKGFHSWTIKIEEFSEHNKMSVIGIGVATTALNDPILGEDTTTYAVQIIEHPKVNIRHTDHRYQLQMPSLKAVGTTVVTEINLDEHWLNIFVNGSQMRRDINAVGSPTFSNVSGEFYPAVSLYGSRIKVSIITMNE